MLHNTYMYVLIINLDLVYSYVYYLLATRHIFSTLFVDVITAVAIGITFCVDFLPPIFNINCTKDGIALLDWSVHPYGNLSIKYINSFALSWTLRGYCINPQGDIIKVKVIILHNCYMYYIFNM